MKIFIVHVNLGCCANNSDGKIWVTADNKDIAKIIVKQHTNDPITMVEEFNPNNEVIYSSCHLKNNYPLQNKTNNWGYLPEDYVRQNHMSETYLESWHQEHANDFDL